MPVKKKYMPIECDSGLFHLNAEYRQAIFDNHLLHPRMPLRVRGLLNHDEVIQILESYNESYWTVPAVGISTISGSQQQWVVFDSDPDEEKKDVCQSSDSSSNCWMDLRSKIAEFLKPIIFKRDCAVETSSILGMLTPQTATPQCPHADMKHPFGFVCIIYLTNCISAYFHDDMFEETNNQLVAYPSYPEVVDDESGLSNWKRYYRANFSQLLSPETEDYSSFHVEPGDIVLFRSDSLHWGPGGDKNIERKMVFFTMNEQRADVGSYNSEEQIQPWVIAEKLYGYDSDIWHGFMRQFRIFDPHLHFLQDDVIENAEKSYVEKLEAELQKGNFFLKQTKFSNVVDLFQC